MASTELPEVIVAEILERVGVKDLVRFKTVCKSWPSIISNSQFIKSHLQRALIAAKEKSTLLTLITREIEPLKLEGSRWLERIDDMLHPEEDNTEDHQQSLEHALLNGKLRRCLAFDHVVIPTLYSSCRVVSSCNGIICQAHYLDGSDIYLWNPSMKQHKKLPVPKQYKLVWLVRVGFGYDSICNDYKVLRFVYKDENDKVPLVQLYSTNADSWREFTDPTLANWRHFFPAGTVVNYWQHALLTNTVVNGVLYFKGGLSFDLHEEVFGLVPFPSFVTESLSHFLDFEGSVAMFFKCSGDDKGFSLYTLDTVCGNWTRKFHLEAELSLILYMGAGLFYGGQIYCHGRRCVYTTLYDYRRNEAFYYQPPVPEENTFGLLKYTESLVSIKGFEQVE